MAIVVGQIESLKTLKERLEANGITRFNSIGDINAFTKNYKSEKTEIKRNIESALDEEINRLQSLFVERTCQLAADGCSTTPNDSSRGEGFGRVGDGVAIERYDSRRAG